MPAAGPGHAAPRSGARRSVVATVAALAAGVLMLPAAELSVTAEGITATPVGLRYDDGALDVVAPVSTAGVGSVSLAASARATSEAQLTIPAKWRITRKGQLKLKGPAHTDCRVVRWTKARSGRGPWRYTSISVQCTHPATPRPRTLRVVNRKKLAQKLDWQWTWSAEQPVPASPVGVPATPATDPATGTPTAPTLPVVPTAPTTPTTPTTAPTTPGPDPGTLRGDANDYALTPQPNDASDVIGFDPCTPIDVAINPNGYPQAEVDRVIDAIGRIAATSGLSVRYAGASTFTPTSEDSSSDEPGIEIVLALASPSRSDLLTGGVLGRGGRWWSGSSKMWLGGGFAVIDTPRVLALPVDYRLVTYLHELGHAIGFGHASGSVQVMYPMVNADQMPPAWGAGDATGLRRLGSLQCRAAA